MREKRDLDPMVWAELTLATESVSRAQGLLFGKGGNKVLLLAPCKDVHTAGMRDSIDVAFVDRSGQVIETHLSVRPFCRLRNCKAAAVMERFSSCQGPWFRTGDRIVVSMLPKEGVGE